MAADVKSIPDIPYAEVDGRQLLLDLALPEGITNPPLVVYVHGGGWRSGDRKKRCWFRDSLVQAGYAVASIQYRLSSQAVFPAQIHDCKGAVRWLRANAPRYGYDASRIVATGGSAGGHLALLLGVTGNDARLECKVGGNLDQSSQVAAVVDFYGPTDFLLRSKDQPEQTEKESGKVYQLLGGPVRKNLDLAKLASPAWHISADDPPLLVFHGTADRKVLLNQSERLRDACRQAGVPLELVFVEGGGHGDSQPPKFATPENEQRMLKFLQTRLKNGQDRTGCKELRKAEVRPAAETGDPIGVNVQCRNR